MTVLEVIFFPYLFSECHLEKLYNSRILIAVYTIDVVYSEVHLMCGKDAAAINKQLK